MRRHKPANLTPRLYQVSCGVWHRAANPPGWSALVCLLAFPILLAQSSTNSREEIQKDLNKKRYEQAREKLLDTRIACDGKQPEEAAECSAQAKFALADTYFLEYTKENLWSAGRIGIGEFQIFLHEYPFHPKAAEAQFKIGMIHCLRIFPPDKHLVPAMSTESEMKALIRDYPDSPLLQAKTQELRTWVSYYPENPKKQVDTESCIQKARATLAEHEAYVAKFYFDKKSYTAAVSRLEELMQKYPDLEELIRNFPEFENMQRARRRLREAKEKQHHSLEKRTNGAVPAIDLSESGQYHSLEKRTNGAVPAIDLSESGQHQQPPPKKPQPVLRIPQPR